VELLTAPFATFAAEEAFADAVAAFEADAHAPIPVWTGARRDLDASVRLAAGLYDRRTTPARAPLGAVLSPPGDAVQRLVDPLAERWTTVEALTNACTRGEVESALIVGPYGALTSVRLRALLLAAHAAGDVELSFLTGRDVHSLAWMVAKQWAAIDDGVTAVGLVSAEDAADGVGAVEVFGPAELDRRDVQREILARRWRRLLFQGHGKDDSVNLGDFTVCGLNDEVAAGDGLRPRCGYGWPCYKDPAKLIPLRRVRAAEVVLSACNSGPLADLALYDPKYVLLLSAVDGPAQAIVTALGVHDSAEPENDRWIGAVVSGPGADGAALLNASLRTRHPHPGFWRFGAAVPQRRPAVAADPPVDAAVGAATFPLRAYLGTSLLPPAYPVRPRLERLARKVDAYAARGARGRGDALVRSLHADLQAIDYTLAARIAEDPEDPVMNWPNWFGDRSEVAPETVREERCSCGRVAERFDRVGVLAGIPTVSCLFCLRCGDVEFAMGTAPRLRVLASDRVTAGGVLAVDVEVHASTPGPVRLGAFVPPYLRDATRVEPALVRIPPRRAGSVARTSITVAPAAEVPAQAYYVTVFAVQHLGVTTHRRHFGVLPR
jgi:hypothetical protein